MMIFFGVFIALLAINASSATTHSSCPGLPEFIDVSLDGCSEQPCNLVSGSTTAFQVKILSNAYVTWMKADIKAIAMGTAVSYPLPNPDVCSSLTDGECPLDKGEVVNYKVLFPILESFPLVPVVATLTINSDQGVQGCMKISLRVVAA
ncbi:Hypothetical protein domain [Nesidiocoris tenuis]|uniref:MD-2-related lipid-recognition domain-containing protein n=1 Tax=Nesidiocoris tenuis TaxID=355587 RepID=A0ABN7ACN8_9HEMI|nr:Hypothetical protein domain [Nesidiocoris tenuis]